MNLASLPHSTGSVQVKVADISVKGKEKPPRFPEGVLALVLSNLLVDLGNGTGTYGAAALTDREA
jgi:hypothetical protein